jgi:radical SAM protein with 4Fe4S-binding SPASM domain
MSKWLVGNRFSRWILSRSAGLAHSSLEILGGRKAGTFAERLYAFGFGLVLRIFMGSVGVPWQEVKRSLADPGIARCFMIVVRSLVKYGYNTPIIVTAPFSVVFNLTNRCNLLCQHCFQKASADQKDLMTKEQKLHIIDQLADAGTAAITFSGGEPLMSDDFWEIAGYGSSKGIFVSIDTNGTLIDGQVASKLVEFGVRYAQVSIDSPDPKVHNQFRGMEGAFDLSMKGVAAMRAVGMYLSMGVTLTAFNADKIDDFIDLAKKHRFNRIVFYHLIPVGRGESIKNLDLTPKQRAEVMEKLANIDDPDIEVLSETPHYATETAMVKGRGEQKLPDSNCFPITSFFNMGKNRRYMKALRFVFGGCPAGRLYANIQPNGDLTPCMFSPFYPVVGNLTRQTLEEAWEGFDMLWDRTRLKGICGNCRHRIECGGCRARAAGMGDALGPDYGCYTTRYMEAIK